MIQKTMLFFMMLAIAATVFGGPVAKRQPKKSTEPSRFGLVTNNPYTTLGVLSTGALLGGTLWAKRHARKQAAQLEAHEAPRKLPPVVALLIKGLVEYGVPLTVAVAMVTGGAMGVNYMEGREPKLAAEVVVSDEEKEKQLAEEMEKMDPEAKAHIAKLEAESRLHSAKRLAEASRVTAKARKVSSGASSKKKVENVIKPFEMVEASDESVNVADENGLTPLMKAVGDKKLDEVAALIAKGGTKGVNQSDLHQGKTALMRAAETGQVEMVNLLASAAGLDGTNLKDRDGGNTALALAARGGHAAVVKHLIELVGAKGAVIPNDSGTTPLIAAVQAGSINCVNILSARIGKEGLAHTDNRDKSARDYAGEEMMRYAEATDAEGKKKHDLFLEMVQRFDALSR